MTIFHEVEGVPANSCILFDSEAAALECPRGDIRLGFCEGCGFVFNTAFDPRKTEYSGRYEETQGFSGTFNRFHKALAERLIERHGLYRKNVLEIGCGKGEFLMLLAELGENRGIGIDPGVHVERVHGPAAERMQFIQDFYSEKYSDHKVDFLACKMTLEHIHNPGQFMRTVRRGLGEQTDAIVFFQIPEALRVFRDCAFEDIYHEHCAYFSPGSLGRLFRRSGFDVLDIQIEYAGQYLTIEARPARGDATRARQLPLENDLQEMRRLVASFPARFEEKTLAWRRKLEDAQAAGKKVALWGSGSKAVSFLTTLRLDKHVGYVTDINPFRHNHFMPGTGQRIVPPAELAQIKPDLVIVMNPIYVDEIGKSLADLGIRPEIESL